MAPAAPTAKLVALGLGVAGASLLLHRTLARRRRLHQEHPPPTSTASSTKAAATAAEAEAAHRLAEAAAEAEAAVASRIKGLRRRATAAETARDEVVKRMRELESELRRERAAGKGALAALAEGSSAEAATEPTNLHRASLRPVMTPERLASERHEDTLETVNALRMLRKEHTELKERHAALAERALREPSFRIADAVATSSDVVDELRRQCSELQAQLRDALAAKELEPQPQISIDALDEARLEARRKGGAELERIYAAESEAAKLRIQLNLAKKQKTKLEKELTRAKEAEGRVRRRESLSEAESRARERESRMSRMSVAETPPDSSPESRDSRQ